MIEGERVVTAMAFNILHIHQKKLISMKDMDEMTEFLQIQLHKDFGYNDDSVIKELEHSMAKLRKHKMDLPPPPQECELPKYEFGRFIEPKFEQKIGRRKTKFTEVERKTTKNVIHRYVSDCVRCFSVFIFLKSYFIDKKKTLMETIMTWSLNIHTTIYQN